MNSYHIGDILLLGYGAGTQLARVVNITKRGGLILARFRSGCVWESPTKAAMRPTDRRILGLAPSNDKRLPEARRQLALATDEAFERHGIFALEGIRHK